MTARRKPTRRAPAQGGEADAGAAQRSGLRSSTTIEEIARSILQDLGPDLSDEEKREIHNALPENLDPDPRACLSAFGTVMVRQMRMLETARAKRGNLEDWRRAFTRLRDAAGELGAALKALPTERTLLDQRAIKVAQDVEKGATNALNSLPRRSRGRPPTPDADTTTLWLAIMWIHSTRRGLRSRYRAGRGQRSAFETYARTVLHLGGATLDARELVRKVAKYLRQHPGFPALRGR